MGFRLGLCLLLLAPLIASGLKLTANEGAGPLYRGRDLPYYLAPLPGQNISSEGGTVARGYLEVPNRSGSTGGVCARVADNPPLTALVVCRSLGWRGAARAAALAPPANSTAVGNGGTAWSSLACNGTEAGLLACRYSRVEANFTGCSPRVRLVIECYSDPGRQGELRFSPAPPAASTVGQQYSQGLTVEVFQDGFWGYPAGPFSPRVAVVLCREAGYTNGTAGVGDTTLAGSGYRPAGNAPKLTSLRCNGTEAALDECRFSYAPPLPFSPYFEYVPRQGSVSYYQGPFLPLLFCPDAFNSTEPAGEDGGAVEQQEYAVRLHSDADTATPADGCVSGRVQMSVGGFWGLVAMGDYGSGATAVADEVAQANAEVICRQLGAGDTGNITTSFDVADADVRLPVWLSDLECGGDEASVLDCGYTSDVVPGGSLRTAPEADYALSVSCCRA